MFSHFWQCILKRLREKIIQTLGIKKIMYHYKLKTYILKINHIEHEHIQLNVVISSVMPFFQLGQESIQSLQWEQEPC